MIKLLILPMRANRKFRLQEIMRFSIIFRFAVITPVLIPSEMLYEILIEMNIETKHSQEQGKSGGGHALMKITCRR